MSDTHDAIRREFTHVNTNGTAYEDPAGYPVLNAPAMIAEIARLRADAARLDWLDAMGLNWIARLSKFGRGFRVHQTTRAGATPVREAIDRARNLHTQEAP